MDSLRMKGKKGQIGWQNHHDGMNEGRLRGSGWK